MVEDNPDDALFLRRRLQNSGFKYSLQIVSDTREAMDYLTGADEYVDRTLFPFPCLLVIELRMPGLDGFTLIDWVNRNSETKDLPVIIYSSSHNPDNVACAYALGAKAYVAKVSGSRSFDLLLSAIQEFCESRSATTAIETPNR